jgi:putative PIN family toxin of toxin-antitoxin system
VRVVLDANIIVSAALSGLGAPAAIVAAFLAGRFEAVFSASSLGEASRVLRRPSMRRRVRYSGDQLDEFLQAIREAAVLVDAPVRLHLVSDPGDNRILEAAAAGEADYVVTGDRELLALGRYVGARIVTPAEFRRMLETGEAPTP